MDLKSAKKIIAVTLAVASVVGLSSCSKKSGVEYYTDTNGNKYLVVREDGDIVVNENNALKVYELNENGKKQKDETGVYITKFIDFNGQISENGYVETKELSFKIPNGFEVIENIPGCFVNDDIGGEIFIDYISDKTGNFDAKVESTEYNCESLLQSYGSEHFSYEKYTVEIDGIEATAFKHSCNSSEYFKTVYYFFVPGSNGFYSINCSVDTNKAKKTDFEKFIRSIDFK